jgi:hypothetical protein
MRVSVTREVYLFGRRIKKAGWRNPACFKAGDFHGRMMSMKRLVLIDPVNSLRSHGASGNAF